MNDLIIIQEKIYEIRGQKVMLDSDLASMYSVETKVLNQAVKRNAERFPSDFMFQLSNDEFTFWKSQNVTSKKETKNSGNRLWSQNVTAKKVSMSRSLPYAFTENGVAMLSSVLRSPLAIQVNIGIMRAFTEFRRLAASLPVPGTNAEIVQLRKDFEELKRDVEDIFHDQNDINEDTRAQLDAISMALAELQAREPVRKERKPIGFIQPKDK